MAARPRSPSYPALSLSEAVERTRQLYEKEGTAHTAPEVAVTAWSYKSLNGASARTLAAVRQYGLVEDVGRDVKISERGLTILLEPESSQDRREAILSASREPTAFADILSEYPNGIPSDQGLIAYLVRKRAFTEDGAKKLNAVLRDTMALVRAYDSTGRVAMASTSAQSSRNPAEIRGDFVAARYGEEPQPTALQLEWRLPLPGGNVVTLAFSRAPSLADLGLLKSYLEVLEKGVMAPQQQRPPAAEHAEDELTQAVDGRVSYDGP
jgi:hypothetical protein